MSQLCRKDRALSFSQLRAIVVRREQVTVAVERYHERRVTEPRLHHLRRQFQSAVLAPVDAPGRVEVAQRMESRIFRLAVFGHYASGDLRRLENALDDVAMVVDHTLARREDQVGGALGRR